MNTKQTLYTKSTCPVCDGTGETGSYVGQCYRCKGEKTIFIEIPKDSNTAIIDKRSLTTSS